MLFLMGVVGLAGMPMALEGKAPWTKIGYAWMVFWWLPPLVTIWMKGVFG
jgi:hypothetical protein